MRADTYGIQGCTYDTAIPGIYPITFSVTVPGTALHASVTRRLVVYPICGVDEFSCTDLRCSLAELCLSMAGSLQLPPNEAPHLRLPEGQLATVSLQAGTDYGKCVGEGAAPVSLQCEAGVTALDAEDGVLTPRVLACPPESCLPFGCPGHEFQTKGTASQDHRALSCAHCVTVMLAVVQYRLQKMISWRISLEITPNKLHRWLLEVCRNDAQCAACSCGDLHPSGMRTSRRAPLLLLLLPNTPAAISRPPHFLECPFLTCRYLAE